MSITVLGVRRAVRALTEAGFRVPPETDLDAMARRWREAITEIDDTELEAAATEYTRSPRPAYAWPTPGQLVECAMRLRSLRTASRSYTEPPMTAPPATPEQVRSAWEHAGIDLDELRRLHQARRAVRS